MKKLKHLFSLGIFSVVLVFGLLTTGCDNGSTSSDATPDHILVSTATELGYVGRGTANPDPYKGWTLDANYKLTANIDMSGVSNFTPISPWVSDDHPHFTGVFDGNGKTISNLTVNSAGDAGLFGYVGPGCTIKNIKLTNVDITTTWNAGAVGGGRGTFFNCVVIGGTVKSIGFEGGYGSVGGVFGWNDEGTVENCYSSNLIVINGDTDSSVTGGVVGSSGTNSTIKNCYASGTVQVSKSYTVKNGGVGGIVGTNWSSGSVLNCVALNESITGTAGNIGRIVGWNSVTLSNNYGRSDMTGGSWTSNANSIDGADVTTTNAETENWWKFNLGWVWGSSESAPWKWDSSTKLPKLWFEN
ncbi:MAG: hypothetical protein FWG29_10345 [Treponema sp.]|nr:hypothetical protein [Treponema sp.]